MALFGTSTRSGSVIAAMAVCLALGGCGSAGGIDLDIDAPALDAIGLNLSSKPKQEAELPERPGIIIPPSTAALPKPGERTAAAGTQNWPVDPDLQKKQKADAETAAREKYCREGDWSGKGGIIEFDKATGREPRCPSKLGESISKNINKSGRVD
jgi:hypothetical protein